MFHGYRRVGRILHRPTIRKRLEMRGSLTTGDDEGASIDDGVAGESVRFLNRFDARSELAGESPEGITFLNGVDVAVQFRRWSGERRGDRNRSRCAVGIGGRDGSRGRIDGADRLVGRIDRIVGTNGLCGGDTVGVSLIDSRSYGSTRLTRVLVAGDEKCDGGEQEKCCFHSIRIPERFRNAK